MLKKLVNLTENLQSVIYQKNVKAAPSPSKVKYTHEVNMYGLV